MTSSAHTSGGSGIEDPQALSDEDLLKALLRLNAPVDNLTDVASVVLYSQEVLRRMQIGSRCSACHKELPAVVSFCENCRSNSP